MTISDFGIVYLDDKFITTLDRVKAVHIVFLLAVMEIASYLFWFQLWVINFDHQMETDFKGHIKSLTSLLNFTEISVRFKSILPSLTGGNLPST